MATPLGSAEWHRLAEQCRTSADEMQDPIIRGRMLMIADGYDRIAHDAAKDRSPGRPVTLDGPLPPSRRTIGFRLGGTTVTAHRSTNQLCISMSGQSARFAHPRTQANSETNAHVGRHARGRLQSFAGQNAVQSLKER